jgi:hypothetical protein
MVNTQDETAEDSVATTVNGFDRLRLTDDSAVVDVIIGSLDRWDRSHLRRLRQSADLPGLVPVIDSDFASDGKPFAVIPVVDEPTLASKIPPRGRGWQECAGITEAAARALHEAHLRGLFHGALSPDQIHIIGDDVAVSGVGLGLGGSPQPDYHHWVAPEVFDGVDPTERSDVYSLGKILEASLGDSLEDVPRSVRRLIMWSGSDTPEARPPSALEFASILAEALGDDRKIYSPAFIPTAEANNLASTAPSAVAAHTIDPGRDRSAGTGLGAVAAGGAVAAAGLGLASQLSDTGDDSAEQAVGDAGSIRPDELDEDQSIETMIDDDSGISVIEDAALEDDAVDEDENVSASADDTELVDADEAEVVESTEVSDEGAAIEGDDEDREVAAAEAASTTQYERDELDVGEAEIDAPRADAIDWGADDDATGADEYAVPAAQTVELEDRYEPDRRNNRAGILIGAIVAAGLSLIAWQLISGDDESTEVANPAATTDVEDDAEAASPSVTEDTTDAQADTADAEVDANATVDDSNESTDAADATGDDTATDDTGTDAGQDTADDTAAGDDDASASADEEAASGDDGGESTVDAVATVDGVLNVADAGVQIVHGIPDTPVDVYVNGEILAPGFTSGTIAGPIKLSPGQYDVAIYGATDGPAAAAADRTDDAVLSQSVTVTADPASLYAHLDANGTPTLSGFVEEFGALSPGQSRIVARHLAQGPEVTVLIDGEPMSASEISNGESYVTDLAAGSHTVAANGADGTEVTKPTTLNLADGEVATVTVIGSADNGTISAVVQRYSGLSSAPAGIPTGDSNLLGMDEDLTSLYLVGILTLAMVMAGGVLMIRRHRRVL